LCKDKAGKLLAKVLNHVIALGFTVDEKVEAALLLETNNGLDLLLDELVVLLGGDLAFAQLGTSLANLFGLLSRNVSYCKGYREWTLQGKSRW
jgi:hypothetical protein